MPSSAIALLSFSKINRGINFVGFRTWQSYRLVRKRTLFHFSRKLKKLNIESITSIMAYSLKTSSINNMSIKIKTTAPELIPLLPHYKEY